MFDPHELIAALAGSGVEYVVIGGFAVGAHGFLVRRVLAVDAVEVTWRGVGLRVCSLEHLRVMKRTAGRPQDLVDLENLPDG